uniref:ionotropic receptor 137 precursor n=1 Tax=Aedes aegypti TaxID=7159 RepID=UPI00043BD0DD|nr:ionotropic receptor 137 precursor [Aedes aegypti]
MSPSGLALAISGLLCTPILAVISPKVQNYTLTAIEYLSELHIDRFECIFCDVSGGTHFDYDFQELIQSPRLDSIAKYVINDSSLLSHRAGLPWFPALVVFNVHAEKVYFNTDQFEINPHTRILILFELDSMYSVVVTLRAFFLGTHFTRMICLESTDMVFIRVGFNGTFDSFLGYLEPSELFKNILYDMGGRTIGYSGSARVSPKHMNWMKETAWYLNATPIYLRAPCDQRLGVTADCYPKFYSSKAVVISLDCISLSSISPQMHRSLFDVVPETNVFAIPLSRAINVLEMFFWPFSSAAWIVLGLIAISLELLNMLYPSLFSNDPTLLVICGFERHSLHTADVKEKLLFLSLIIFFFLMTNAYETRIISFMIEKPSIHKIRTLQELIESGLRLAAEKVSKIALFNDPRFSGMLLDISNHSVDNLDGINAFYGPSSYMEDRIRMPVNYDYKRRRPAYYILDETNGMAVCLYWLPLYDSLMEMFYYTERIFFEAGLLTKWTRDDSRNFSSYQVRLLRRRDLNFADFQDRLGFDDMLPAWIAIGVGLVAGWLVFVGELILFRCFSMYDKTKDVGSKVWVL